MSLSPQNDGLGDNGTPLDFNHRSPQAKRKRPSGLRADERKKVSRACDACKLKKVRCAGTQPCPRCVNQSLQCLYDKVHRRGKPSPPEPGIPSNNHGQSNVGPGSSVPAAAHGSGNRPSNTNQSKSLEPIDQSLDPRNSSRSSQEPDGGRFEGDYIGPTSGIAFLHRAQKRFQQDSAAIQSQNSENHGSQKVSVFSFGDGWVPGPSALEFSLPSRVDAKQLLDRYFDFAMPTYRFVHRPTVEAWLETMYDTSTVEKRVISNAKRAIAVLIFATATLYNENAKDVLPDGRSKQSEEIGMFFTEAERLLNNENGPVTVESVQARLAQCIHLLASSRINQAWYIFGTATQMISALGLHRKPHTKSSILKSESFNIDIRRRVFWSAYTLDRYLSVILGRPRIFRDEDIDQTLPESLSERSWDSSLTESKATLTVSDGPIYHARLAKILGSISTDLYTSRTMDKERMEASGRWTAELKQWKESLPAFLEPTKVDPSMLVPIFQRQSTVLRLAYAHALILANRPSLLSSFADLSRWQGIPLGEPTGSLKECIDAALMVVVIVNGLIEAGQMPKAFWFTHYISFCAISALYVYTIQQCLPHQTADLEPSNHESNPADTRYFEAATRCQKRIEDTTTMTSPFRRYNIILDELKKEVMHHLSTRTARTHQEPVNIANRRLPLNRLVDSSGGTPSITPTNPIDSAPFTFPLQQSIQPQPFPNSQLQPQLSLNAIDMRPDFGPTASPSLDDSMMMDLGVFGLQGELMGWSEFDSCAINWQEGLDVFGEGI